MTRKQLTRIQGCLGAEWAVDYLGIIRRLTDCEGDIADILKLLAYVRQINKTKKEESENGKEEQNQ